MYISDEIVVYVKTTNCNFEYLGFLGRFAYKKTGMNTQRTRKEKTLSQYCYLSIEILEK